MTPSELSPESLLSYVLDVAKRHGASAADALFVTGVSTDVKVRLGKTESVHQSRSKGIGIRVFFGQRSATTSTNDLRRDALEGFIERICQSAKVVAEDATAGLPAPELFSEASVGDLDLFDPAIQNFSVEDALDIARRCEAASMSADARIVNSEGGDMSWGHSQTTFANSMGTFRQRRGGSAGFWTSPIAEAEGGMERDYWYTSARHLSDLESPEAVGQRAARRALRRLGGVQPTTAELPVIYENTVASRMLGALASAICGGSVYRNLSYLAGKVDTTIASSLVHIKDDPHIQRAPASRAYDGEGLATRPLDVVTGGELKSYLLDTYSARKMGLQTTRSASRGLSGAPSASPSNFWMSPGEQTLDELIGDVKRGIFVTELLGMGVNTVTGDYSQGAAGIWIENGKLTHPVNELTVASTLQDIWMDIDGIASDLDRTRSISSPSFRIRKMTIGGA